MDLKVTKVLWQYSLCTVVGTNLAGIISAVDTALSQIELGLTTMCSEYQCSTGYPCNEKIALGHESHLSFESFLKVPLSRHLKPGSAEKSLPRKPYLDLHRLQITATNA